MAGIAESMRGEEIVRDLVRMFFFCSRELRANERARVIYLPLCPYYVGWGERKSESERAVCARYFKNIDPRRQMGQNETHILLRW